MSRPKTERSRLVAKVAELKETIEEIQKQKDALIADRKKYREYFVSDLRFHIRLNGERKYQSSASAIEDRAKFLGKVEQWWWGGM